MTAVSQSAFETDVGKKRKTNQDRFLDLPSIGLFAIADGMGGHQGGETASLLAIQTLQFVFEKQHASTSPRSPEAATILKQAFLQANKAIFETAQKQPELKGMGTTLTAAWVDMSATPTRRKAFIAQVGDSRCYLIRGTHAFQVTRDHSQIAEKVRARVYTKEEARTQKGRNILTRAIGYEPAVVVDVWEADLTPGDRLLLCSDGLHGQLPEADWLKRACGGNDLQGLARDLIALALHHGGEDNTTVGLVQVN